MTKYIAIEDDNVMSLFGKFWYWDGKLQWMLPLVMLMNECLVIKHDMLILHLKVWVIIAGYKDLFGNEWQDYFLPWSFYAPAISKISNDSTSDFNANLTAMEHVLNVLSHHSQIIAQTSINSMMSNMHEKSSRSQREVVSTLLFKCPERKWSHGTRWNNLISHTIALSDNDTSIKLAKLVKSGKWHCHLNGNVLIHAWHTWCKKGINGKRIYCPLLICHTKLFKSSDIKTMGLWIWITFFDTHCIMLYRVRLSSLFWRRIKVSKRLSGWFLQMINAKLI